MPKSASKRKDLLNFPNKAGSAIKHFFNKKKISFQNKSSKFKRSIHRSQSSTNIEYHQIALQIQFFLYPIEKYQNKTTTKVTPYL